GDKNVFVVSQENALCASRWRRKAVKLQFNRRRRRGPVGLRWRGLLLSIGSNGDLWLRYVNKHPEDIPSIAFILQFFAGLQHIKPQTRIQGLRRIFLGRGIAISCVVSLS